MTDKPDPSQHRKSAAAPASYEVQVFAGGKWATELVLQDRQEAEDEANRILDSSRRPLGVRVVREEVDENTSLITATTVFRRSREDERSAEEKADKRLQMKAKVTEIRADRRKTTKAPARADSPSPAAGPKAARSVVPAKSGMHWMWLLVLLAVLVIAGLLTLLKLHSLFLE